MKFSVAGAGGLRPRSLRSTKLVVLLAPVNSSICPSMPRSLLTQRYRNPLPARKSAALTKLELIRAIENNELSLGEAVRNMRKIAGMSQKDYATRIVGIATRIFAEAELGQGNPTLDTLNKIGRPFGYRVGFVCGKSEMPATRHFRSSTK